MESGSVTGRRRSALHSGLASSADHSAECHFEVGWPQSFPAAARRASYLRCCLTYFAARRQQPTIDFAQGLRQRRVAAARPAHLAEHFGRLGQQLRLVIIAPRGRTAGTLV